MARAPSRFAAALGLVAILQVPALGHADARDAGAYIEFVEDDDANCGMREGRMILVRSTHPDRSIRCWFERYHMEKPTGDRSRSELAPAAEAEKLGCSRTQYGGQEWRVVKAQFVD